MKKILALMVAISILLTACSQSSFPPEPGEPGEGKAKIDTKTGAGIMQVPKGYAPPVDIFDNDKQITSLKNSVIEIEDGQKSAKHVAELEHIGGLIYNKGHYYSTAGKKWVQFKLDGESFKESNWLKENGAASLDIPKSDISIGENYIITYSCKKYDNEWKCGCRETNDCGYWMLNTFLLRETDLPPEPLPPAEITQKSEKSLLSYMDKLLPNKMFTANEEEKSNLEKLSKHGYINPDSEDYVQSIFQLMEQYSLKNSYLNFKENNDVDVDGFWTSFRPYFYSKGYYLVINEDRSGNKLIIPLSEPIKVTNQKVISSLETLFQMPIDFELYYHIIPASRSFKAPGAYPMISEDLIGEEEFDEVLINELSHFMTEYFGIQYAPFDTFSSITINNIVTPFVEKVRSLNKEFDISIGLTPGSMIINGKQVSKSEYKELVENTAKDREKYVLEGVNAFIPAQKFSLTPFQVDEFISDVASMQIAPVSRIKSHIRQLFFFEVYGDVNSDGHGPSLAYTYQLFANGMEEHPNTFELSIIFKEWQSYYSLSYANNPALEFMEKLTDNALESAAQKHLLLGQQMIAELKKAVD
ncbi:hypothetical protein J4401_03600 [Candidatus Woesearchaeota archaeon]|nr:hypothetical protein [Candidatus Woesearchaeota archaeon]